MSPVYQVEIVGAAKRQLRKLSKENQRRVLDAIEKLAQNPRPHGYKQLEARENLFRYQSRRLSRNLRPQFCGEVFVGFRKI